MQGLNNMQTTLNANRGSLVPYIKHEIILQNEDHTIS